MDSLTFDYTLNQRSPESHSGVDTLMLGGFATARVSRTRLANIMVRDCFIARTRETLPKLVFSSNGQGIALAGADSNFSRQMAQADIIHADGMSVVYASRLLYPNSPLPERVATTDFFHDAAKAAEEQGLSLYMLGGEAGVNRETCNRIRKLYPNLNIVGSRDGYFSREEEADVCAEIQVCKPDVLWVALGKPKQEQFCVRNREALRGIGWVKTCGGLYDFISGRAPRAPLWMQNYGLEWLYRAMNDPRRLAMRYATSNISAAYFLATQSGH